MPWYELGMSRRELSATNTTANVNMSSTAAAVMLLEKSSAGGIGATTWSAMLAIVKPASKPARHCMAMVMRESTHVTDFVRSSPSEMAGLNCAKDTCEKAYVCANTAKPVATRPRVTSLAAAVGDAFSGTLALLRP